MGEPAAPDYISTACTHYLEWAGNGPAATLIHSRHRTLPALLAAFRAHVNTEIHRQVLDGTPLKEALRGYDPEQIAAHVLADSI